MSILHNYVRYVKAKITQRTEDGRQKTDDGSQKRDEGREMKDEKDKVKQEQRTEIRKRMTENCDRIVNFVINVNIVSSVG